MLQRTALDLSTANAGSSLYMADRRLHLIEISGNRREIMASSAKDTVRRIAQNTCMRFGWMRAGVALGLIVCGAVAWLAVHYVVQARDPGTAGTVAQGLAAVLVPMAGLAVWLVHQFWPDVSAIDSSQAAGDLVRRQAADDLATRVERQWRDAASQRGLFDQPLAVRWTWSQRGLSGPVAAAVGHQRAMRIVPLPEFSRVRSRQLREGNLNDLFKVYGGLGSGRMVLAGAPGAGKSAAMIRLLLDAIDHRKGIQDEAVRAKVPVPVLLTAYDWLPDHERLADWVTRRLEDEHPFLKARIGTVSAARALVNDEAVSVLLDGVDEMPEKARASVLRQIGRQARHRVVLSCRTDELQRAAASGHLPGAAALELAAITPQKAADYLEARAVHPVPDRWRKLIQHLRENEASPAAQALDTPLMLSLLLATYGRDDPVNELTDKEKFPGRQEIEKHLLSRVLTAAYTRRPGEPVPPCTPEKSGQWLGYLAAQMNQRKTPDLAWWSIPQWLPPRHLKVAIGIAGGLINALVGGLAFGIAIGVVFGSAAGLAAGLAVGVASGVVFGLAAGLGAGLSVGLRSGVAIGLSSGVEVGLAAGIIGGLRFGVNFGLAAGITIGLTVALTVALTIGLTAGLASSPDAKNDNGFPPQYRGLRGRGRLPHGDIVGVLAVGLASGLVLGLASGLAAGLAVGIKFGLGTGLGSGIAAGIGSGLASGLTQVLNISASADELITPIDSYQGNHRLVSVIEVAVGVAVGIATGIAFGISIWVAIGLVPGVVVGIGSGVAIGALAGIAAGATNVNFFMPAFAAFALMRRANQGPVRMMSFLEDARRRGILRTAGPAYQFCHARLQDLLAENAAKTSRPEVQASPAAPAASVLDMGQRHAGTGLGDATPQHSVSISEDNSADLTREAG